MARSEILQYYHSFDDMRELCLSSYLARRLRAKLAK
jgi:hypothetical protein